MHAGIIVGLRPRDHQSIALPHDLREAAGAVRRGGGDDALLAELAVDADCLQHDVGCNPCRRGCPSLPCMAALQVEEVVTAALELVAARTLVD